jgi:hypothetical protein
VTAVASVAFGDVEGDRTERAAELVPQVTVVMANASHEGSEYLDSFDGQVENEKRAMGCF